MVEIKDRLYQLMSELSITQTDIVNKTGIKKSTLSMYLNGNRIPKQDKIFLIANAYNVNEAWIMGLDVPMEKNTKLNDPIGKAKYLKKMDKYEKIVDKLDQLSEEELKEVESYIDYIISKKGVN